MSSHPHQPGSEDADPEEESTPGGVVEYLEEMAEELGATTDPPKD
jgi:hypothetical protein